ncbi:hypothetical protein CYLTODRAFT_238821 [Cylindrobasidium torrendii FP15055 ss-10]|uniref:Uncharacterized protein n=1 Tax=Cylindrobasidium torrendii FP15055 ss-10 TaxID=1314674 RepID=A0A0D7BSF7_9AGAR|nr:hypothetical protein CYLTODRAFT_238821 [Cylindrobasidium torrendii FP15055 ss-10]
MPIFRSYIGLFREISIGQNRGRGFFHWTLIVKRTSSPNFNDPVDIYQIGYNPASCEWVRMHSEEKLKTNPHLFALVSLPSINAPDATSLRNFLLAESPTQDGTPLAEGRSEWSGSQWTTRTIQHLLAKHWNVRYGTAAKCEYSLDGHIEDKAYVGVIQDGVRVLSLRIDENYQSRSSALAALLALGKKT